MTIRRFDRGPTYMEENDSGSWVRYDDHAAVLDYKLAEASKELTAVVERLYRAEKERDTLRDEVQALRLVGSEVRQLLGTLDSEGRAGPAHISALRAVVHRTQRFSDATAAAGIKGVE